MAESPTLQVPLRNMKGYLSIKYTFFSRKPEEGMGQNQDRYLKRLHVTSNIQHQARGLLVIASAREQKGRGTERATGAGQHRCHTESDRQRPHGQRRGPAAVGHRGLFSQPPAPCCWPCRDPTTMINQGPKGTDGSSD